MNEQWQRWDASGGIIRTNSGSDGTLVVASYERTVAAMGCSGGIIRTNSGSDGIPVVASYERTVAAMGYQWWHHMNSGGIIRTNSGTVAAMGWWYHTNEPVVVSYERTVAAMGCQWGHHTNQQWQRWDASGGII